MHLSHYQRDQVLPTAAGAPWQALQWSHRELVQKSAFPFLLTDGRPCISYVSKAWHSSHQVTGCNSQGTGLWKAWEQAQGVPPPASPKAPGAGLLSPLSSVAHLPVRQDTLSDLTHEDKEQHEGKDPAQVVTREMEPGAVVNVHLGALAAPSCRERCRRWEARLEVQPGDRETIRILLPQG